MVFSYSTDTDEICNELSSNYCLLEQAVDWIHERKPIVAHKLYRKMLPSLWVYIDRKDNSDPKIVRKFNIDLVSKFYAALHENIITLKIYCLDCMEFFELPDGSMGQYLGNPRGLFLGDYSGDKLPRMMDIDWGRSRLEIYDEFYSNHRIDNHIKELSAKYGLSEIDSNYEVFINKHELLREFPAKLENTGESETCFSTTASKPEIPELPPLQLKVFHIIDELFQGKPRPFKLTNGDKAAIIQKCKPDAASKDTISRAMKAWEQWKL